MAKTWVDLLGESRVILQDTDSTSYRLSDSLLLAKLNRGLQELGRLRPDAFWDYFDSDGVQVFEVVTTDANPDTDPDEFDELEDGEVATTDTFPLDMMFYAPLVYWVTASAELVDDEFTDDGRLMTLMGQFKTMVLSL